MIKLNITKSSNIVLSLLMLSFSSALKDQHPNKQAKYLHLNIFRTQSANSATNVDLNLNTFVPTHQNLF